jgi:hypothetical protein
VATAQAPGEAPPSLRDFFDHICGTSTGGLIALALTTPRQAANGEQLPPMSVPEVLGFYDEIGPLLFPPNLLKRTLNVVQRGAQYDRAPLERYLKQQFGDIRMSSCNPAVSVYCVKGATGDSPVYVFSSYSRHGKNLVVGRGGTEAVRVVDAALATSAAPWYFGPYSFAVNGRTRPLESFADGGLKANNPSHLCLQEVRSLYPEARVELLVSFGTGQTAIMPGQWDSPLHIFDPRTWTNLCTETKQAHEAMIRESRQHGRSRFKYIRFNPGVLQIAGLLGIGGVDIGLDVTDPRIREAMRSNFESHMAEKEGDMESIADIIHEGSQSTADQTCTLRSDA